MTSNTEPLTFNSKEKLILSFLNYWKRPIRAGDIAKELEMKHSTLNSNLRLLEGKDLIIWEKYGAVQLTAEGKNHSDHLKRHHHLFAIFLSETLDMDPTQVHNELPLSVTSNLPCSIIEKVATRYDDSKRCVYCDNEIPAAKGLCSDTTKSESTSTKKKVHEEELVWT